MTTPPVTPAEAPKSAAAIFSRLDDGGKVDFSSTELDDVYDGLDRLIKARAAIKVRVEDENGLMAVTVGYDGRTLELWVAEGATTQLDHLALEQKMNELTELAQEEVRRARAEIDDQAIDYLPPD